MTRHLVPAAVVLATMVAACSKSEAPPSTPSQSSVPKAFTPKVATELDEGAKDRLARREAASRMLEKNVLEPTPPRAPEPTVAPRASEPAKPAPTPAPRSEVNAASKPAEPPKMAAAPVQAPAPAVTPPSAPAPAPPPAAAANPPKAAPATSPKTDLASAAPATAAASSSSTRLVSRIDPDFPREAVQAGVDQGTVKARMTLDATGGVTRVEIVDANPRRVFDRAVMRALSQWRYNTGTNGRTVEMEVAFRR